MNIKSILQLVKEKLGVFWKTKEKSNPISQKIYRNNQGQVQRVVFTIPIGNINRIEAEKRLRSLISSYTMPVNWPYSGRKNRLKEFLDQLNSE